LILYVIEIVEGSVVLKRIHYFFWKRSAKKAIALGRTTSCVSCDDPIMPGDLVAACCTGDAPEKKKLVHAGHHFSLTEMDAFCETAAVGCAVWDGKEVIGIGEAIVSNVIRTDKPQLR
jgi:hypothetical protein